jgi:ComF family protein
MKIVLKKFLDTILPPRCIKCGKVLSGENGLCPDCFNEINFISTPYCKCCGKPFHDLTDSGQLLCGKCVSDDKPLFRLSRSSLEYDDSSKPLVLGFKFYDKTDNVKVFGKWMKMSAKDIINEGVDLIVPIPLHYTRLVKRRYNQAALLAKELSKLSDIEVDYFSVVRHKRTRPQMELFGNARVKNVYNAFSVKNADKIKDKRILLIDDVLTTGSTLNECAKALHKAGAKSVDALTLARVDR